MTSESLLKGGANWVDGDRFFNRKVELVTLEERVRGGISTLLTAQRRMGKTSLVRELLRRLEDSGEFVTFFVDLEASVNREDALAEIAIQTRSVPGIWGSIKAVFKNFLPELSNRMEEIQISELKIKLRAGIDPGNWQQRGDQIFAALASSDKPIVLALDELPILINRLLKGQNDQITPEGSKIADEFLSWLRKNAQCHQHKVTLIVSGSIGLEPILRQAGLSSTISNFSRYELKPWSEDIAKECLAALAQTYGLDLPDGVRQDMCQRLRCCIPHHVQMFFDHLHNHLRKAERTKAIPEDIEHVYYDDLLSVHGQGDMNHYETRLKTVLGTNHRLALELLTEAAVNKGLLSDEIASRYRERSDSEQTAIDYVLEILEHDGYLARQANGYRFVSGFIEDWWEARYGRHFVSVASPKGSRYNRNKSQTMTP